MSYYSNILIVGNSALTHKVAVFLQKYDTPVSVYVYDNSIFNRVSIQPMCEASGISCDFGDGKKLKSLILTLATQRLLIFSVVNMYLFPNDLISHPNISIINYHNSKLPKHRGMYAEAWQIYEMDYEAGVTWHFVGDKIDGGNILVQGSIPLNSSFTSIKLLKHQSLLAYELFTTICDDLTNNNLPGTPQIVCDNNRPHFGNEIPNNGFLNIDWDFLKTSAFLRAMDYGPNKTLGSGKLVYKGNTYIWNRYSLDESLHECEAVSVEENTITIVKPSGKITLKNIQLVED